MFCERTVMAALCVSVLTLNMFLSVFFLPGELADCPDKSKLFITAPKKMEALSGSCLHVPCSFTSKGKEDFKSHRTTFGVWIKKHFSFDDGYKQNVIFNSSSPSKIYPMEITGNLSQKNCSTLFNDLTTNHSDTYYFRIENEPLKATAVCDPLQIRVQDSPWSPSINISAGDLKEKQSVSITCSALTPCPHSPPRLTWNLHPDSDSETEENTDGTFTTKLQQTVTLSHTHDGYNISCSATYPVNGGPSKTAETQQTLSVSYAPRDTSASISPSGLLSAGIWVNLTCSSRAKPPISSFTWFKTTTDGPKKVHEGHMYSLNVTDGADYYCVAVNALGNQTSWVHVNASDVFPHTAAVAAVITVLALVCLAVCVWRFKKHQQQTQSQTAAQLPPQTPAAGTQEELHYGEISFFNQRPGPSSVSVPDSGQQQDSVYAQVKVNQGYTQSADTEQLYAQVKKK
ncbi:sialic acid-binding Ig-like lectin 7 [Parambassis ranga]|uniref:Sialic acid-binding Ig-like lectin 7 n=1 Tax=Parambassis ranga TaxID=210632 RepID=A0A6P7KHC9_9TELE|nr:sialic acid-binding Ig-like lectin 7 [Parambassis ranga]